jgi:carboxyl-terminal processing protease
MLEMLLLATLATACPEHERVLTGAAAVIESHYVDAGQASQIAQAVREWSARGHYRGSCNDPAAFLWELNRNLDAYDGHFHVERTKEETSSGDDWLMAWRAQSGPSNAGVREVRVMEGNVGYLRLTTFYPWDIAKPKLVNAFKLLDDTTGLILDLRQNGGGDAYTANQLVRAFLGENAGSVQRIESRRDTKADPLPKLDMPSFDRPIVVLVDRRSASASEFVAYALQAAGRAKVVGARSAGAASMLGEPIKLPDGYQIHIPEARPVNLTTVTNWEGDGVLPDVPGGDDPIHVARRILADMKPEAP